ncbi:hypothetical protein RO3G_06803 [Rhizopus delemar RA 99-880]|uniref:Uncharacterized protein n=1 Tax=Rhizopus delemar (strain RA 99-880 / ATCC MYA-4621 / FGSC 9543 / NRRL 43880) TaxID=246409 RepID=I1C0W8_RHIO9|nr:hypothetical protein RO3G_06803 [Rhizopus delemar RA 99-880]|eukprot:EIE82098.1 hypothetical protein RO3G_06803 [Rhizopus delemar RA 99-880]
MQLFVISKSTSVDPTPSPDVIDTLKATLHFPFLHNTIHRGNTMDYIIHSDNEQQQQPQQQSHQQVFTRAEVG